MLTDVPPNASELARDAGAELVPFDAAAVARAVDTGLADAERWLERRSAALAYVSRFDWEVLLSDLARSLRLEVR